MYKIKLSKTIFLALLINNCNNLQLSGTHHINSPKSQISINQCKNATLSGLTITAPGNSPNTDGIDIAQSSFINIHHSTISTGDDCIALNDGTSNINITYINCGPGHGISIGSLGKNGAYETVEQVYVSYCSFNGTTNGVRIKTWLESGVEIIGVIYKDVKGTSASEVAINLDCRSSKGCSDIIMEEINIAPSNTMAICNYASGKASFVSPKVPCLV
ncbi:putative polygalacturonase [Lupinus albus]|uniref:Putative polygalacturonase n=1 Tax=Lupinus albus TaxID=3870 RepID=A0A6A4Q368_LUPAL|nr:putative polygalacturonase [Lupinus albus]